MIGCVNICGTRGFTSLNPHDPLKGDQLIDWIVRDRCDAVFLTESHGAPDEPNLLHNFFNRSPLGWHVIESSLGPATAGCAFCFNPRIFSNVRIVPSVASLRGRYLELLADSISGTYRFIGIYAPSDAGVVRTAFYGSLPNIPVTHPIVVMGDFNLVLRPEDRIGSSGFTLGQAGRYFQDWLSRHNLLDLSVSTGNALGHTWWRSPGSSARLDRTYVSHGVHATPTTSIFQPHDHCAITAKFVHSPDVDIGPGRWILNCQNLTDPALKERISSLLSDFRARLHQRGINPTSLWDQFNASSIDICKSESVRIHRAKVADRRALQDDIRSARLNWETDPSEANAQTLMALAAKWRLLVTDQVEAIKIAAKSKFYLEPDRFTNELHRKVAGFRRRQFIAKLNRLPSYPAAVSRLAIAQQYFKLQFKSRPTSDQARQALLRHIRQLSIMVRLRSAEFEAEPSLDEMLAALRSLSRLKSPGDTGLTAEFFQAFPDSMELLRAAWLHSRNVTKRLPNCERRILVTLVPKKGDLADIRNYRPISLANIGYKIIAKVYANRLNKVLDKIVDVEQSGFVPGRNIRDNVLEAMILSQAAQRDKSISGAVLFLDFEKAYDRISRKFIFQVLGRLGFGPAFIDAVRVLHWDTVGRVMVNQHISEFFEINSGVKQGCPLAPLLFTIATQPLQAALRSELSFHGIHFHGYRMTHRLYADDSTLFARDEQDARTAMHVVQLFCSASAMALNFSKCKILLLNLNGCVIFDPGSNDRNNPPMAILSDNDFEPLLGMKMNPLASQEGLLECLEQKMRDKVAKWTDRDVPLLTKVSIVKMSFTPLLWYLWTFLRVRDQHLDAMRRLIDQFTWKGAPLRLKQTEGYRPVRDGGLAIPDLEATRCAIKAKIVQRVLASCCSPILRHLFLSQASTLWLQTRADGSNLSYSALHGPFPRSYLDSGIVGECLYYWSLYRIKRIGAHTSPVIGDWFCPANSLPLRTVPAEAFKLTSAPVLTADCYSLDHLGCYRPNRDPSGNVIQLQAFPPTMQALSMEEITIPSDKWVIPIAIGSGDIPSPEQDLFLLNRFHGVAPPPTRTLLSDLSFRKATQKSLSTLQLSALPAHSVFYKWPGQEQQLSKLLRWLRRAPLGPDNKSFVLRFLHKKTYAVQPGLACHHCGQHGAVHGFDHEQFGCRLTSATHIYFVRQMAVWCGTTERQLIPFLDRLFIPCSLDKPFALSWNVAYWLLRRAIYSSGVLAKLNGSLLSPGVIIVKWRRHLLDLLSVISRSEVHAEKFSCGGRWLRRVGERRYNLCLEFLPLP